MNKRDRDELENGSLYRFTDWPVGNVPQIAAGVYTVWRGDDLLYVGMAGRSLTHADIEAKRNSPPAHSGPGRSLKDSARSTASTRDFFVNVFELLG